MENMKEEILGKVLHLTEKGVISLDNQNHPVI